MTQPDRRTVLKMLGVPAVAAALPATITDALAIPASSGTRTIKDVEHVIFLMQENRSFDHYFGTMRGVRGFADPRAVRLPSGRPVWFQPDGGARSEDAVLPFRPPVRDLGQTFLPDPPHGWVDTHAAWNRGWQDQFVPNKGVTAMTYHTRDDLPYQYALADAFTVCDAYHCSLMGPTDPNRYHMWTGWVGNDGSGGGPVISNAEAGYDWSTYPERLQRAGISWRVYQDSGVGLDAEGFWGWTGSDPFIGNYGDNSLLYFHQYQHAPAGSPLARRARTGTHIKSLGRRPERLFDTFRHDVATGTLPQVSWIVAPEAYTEHPNWKPDFGAWYVSQIVNILAAHPEVWSKMVLFVTYDEEGGFFDHVVPPTPPPAPGLGRSGVRTENEVYPGDPTNPQAPYGLGMRVPMVAVSPWSRGGWVNSQVFDHTSLIRFLEARFADEHPELVETNITPWRRAVAGDLTSVFDFENPNSSRRLRLPTTEDFKPQKLTRRDDMVPEAPANQHVPHQEQGVRPARALPYRILVEGMFTPGALHLDFLNAGGAAGVLQVRPLVPHHDPRSYTVAAQGRLRDKLPIGHGSFDVDVHGPNGLHRHFRGSGAPQLAHTVRTHLSYGEDSVLLSVVNLGSTPLRARVHDVYSGHRHRLDVGPFKTATKPVALRASGGWYELMVTLDEVDYTVTYAGHVENGLPSISDPLMGGLLP
jgi:phospholipase C